MYVFSLRKFRQETKQGVYHLISQKPVASYRLVPNIEDSHIEFPTQDPHPATQNRNLLISTTKEMDQLRNILTSNPPQCPANPLSLDPPQPMADPVRDNPPGVVSNGEGREVCCKGRGCYSVQVISTKPSTPAPHILSYYHPIPSLPLPSAGPSPKDQKKITSTTLIPIPPN